MNEKTKNARGPSLEKAYTQAEHVRLCLEDMLRACRAARHRASMLEERLASLMLARQKLAEMAADASVHERVRAKAWESFCDARANAEWMKLVDSVFVFANRHSRVADAVISLDDPMRASLASVENVE